MADAKDSVDVLLSKLRAPFDPKDIDWRVQRSGIKNGNAWVQVVTYINNRAVQERLDSVMGPANWRNEFQPGPAGGTLAGISLRLNGEWVTKWDGADNTQIEPVKGGISDAMKRAAVQWGIGRYLYKLEAGYCPVSAKGDNYIKVHEDPKNKNSAFKIGYWTPPQLPRWAMPVSLPDKKVDAAALITGQAPEKPDTVDNPPRGAQLIKIKELWNEAGADPKQREQWIKDNVKTEEQAEQAIEKLEKAKTEKEERNDG